ncbi:hypothetical protein MTsDn1_14970 [Alteromonas sp. MTD1]|uniref:hypothetical protein n=1 Tax=Alteromonas sp. MTD1 TaxID=3057962 RepID=UPI0036F26C75
MQQINILVIALKIAAIVLFLDVIKNVPNDILNIQVVDMGLNESTIFTLVVIPAIIKTFVALVLWFFPKLLITSVAPDAAKLDGSLGQAASLYKAIIPAIGVYVVSMALADLSYFISLQGELQRQYSAELQPSDKAGFVATIVQIAIGALLIVGSNFMNKMMVKIRG